MSRLISALMLKQAGYRVGRYVSLERITEDSKESYYAALQLSSDGWHEGRHDLSPWWSYSLMTMIAAYGEFERRVSVAKAPLGAKTQIVHDAFGRMPKQYNERTYRCLSRC